MREPHSTPVREVTALLQAWSEGDRAALDRLVPLVYEELRVLARRALRGGRPGQTLQTTALVHEAYLRLVDQKRTQWQNRGHFMAIAAQAMRRVLVDHARRRAAAKRGGGDVRVTLGDVANGDAGKDVEVLAVDQALRELEKVDLQLARLVELRFFAGLSVAETAEVLQVSRATVGREWSAARAWLFRELKRP